VIPTEEEARIFLPGREGKKSLWTAGRKSDIRSRPIKERKGLELKKKKDGLNLPGPTHY